MKHYTAKRFRTEETLGRLIAQSHAALRARMDVELGDGDLTSAQWLVLMKLSHSEHRTAAELATVLNQDAGAMTRMLDRLEAKALLRRVRSQTDRRVIELELTDEGTALAATLIEPAVRVINEALAGFSKDESDQLHSLLARLRSALLAGSAAALQQKAKNP